MARLLYVTQWFDPEPNIIKGPVFVRALEAAGHSVDVLTGFPNYPTGNIYPGYRLKPLQRETLDGVRVWRVPLYPSHDASSLGRSLNFASFFISVLVFLLIRGRHYDAWYVYHPPITPGVAAAVAGKLLRRPFLLEIQDLWPDTVTVSNMSGTRRLETLLDALCNFTYRHARRIVVQSQGIAGRLRQRGVPPEKIGVVRNWADDSALTLPTADRADLGLTNDFTIVYAGNLGRMQALETALQAMAALQAKGSSSRLVLIGDGIDKDALKAEADRLELRNVRFVGRVPQQEIGRWLSAADAVLLHIADDPLFAITIPSKTQFYLASGRPIIAGIAGETAELLAESGAACVVPPENAVALADAIEKVAALNPARREAMSAAGKAYYRAHFAFDLSVHKTLALLDAAL